MYEIASLDLPFTDTGKAIDIGSQIESLPKMYSSDLSNLIKRCLSKEPSNRPSPTELKEITQSYLNSGSWRKETTKISCPNPKCGKPIKEGKTFCSSCGANTVQNTIPCVKCNYSILIGKKFCNQCGTRI